MVKIGLFGGSFNPPTKAHLYVAEQLIERGIVDEVQFVPAYTSYHGKTYEATSRERIDMLELIIKTSDYAKYMSVNSFEIMCKMKSSTYDFVVKFLDVVKLDKDTQYYFIVGGDNAHKVPFIVVNRNNEGIETIEWCNTDPHITINIGDVHPFCSSTEIRTAINDMEGNGLPKKFFKCCELDVFAYILNYELYMGNEK
jgi:nicotinate (nicotinamide) nucleotide adenylyltransferase